MKVPKLPKHKALAALTGASILACGLAPLPVQAAASIPAPSARISFTFDDGLASAITQAAPTLQKYNIPGTDYVISGCVGMTTAPNTCAANTDALYMDWNQVTQLQNTYGWEIGGHTVDHPQLATDKLTNAQLTQEIAGNKSALEAHGFTGADFATPYGDYNNNVLAYIAKSFASHRGFWDVANNVWPGNDYLINDMQVQYGVTVAQVESRIDQAIANNQWLVLTMHDIKPTPSTNPQDYEFATSNLDQIAAYVKAKQDAGLIKAVKVQDGLVTNTGANLLTNSSFDNGIAQGWTTDNATAVVKDTGSNGSYVSGTATGATNSVKFTAGTTALHLFSPKVSVDSTQTYMLKSFLNLQARTSGEVGYYVDEYDANGNWVSGQWVKSETAPIVKEEAFTYKPSSASVKQASLQTYVTANSGITAYVDNYQWFPLVDPAAPAPTNVMTNGTFDAGISQGWTADSSTAFKADATNNGSPENPVNSVALTAGATNTHLFAPKVDVSNTVTYTIQSFAKLLTLTSGELGYYVDEYDTNGNWISGQYLGGQRSVGTNTISFTYTPSSANVKKAGLQVILVGNSGITGYVDNVKWLVPTGGNTPPPTPTPVTVFSDTFATGFGQGWTTDAPANITADSSNHGAPDETAHSVKLTASATSNVHLFGPKVAVTSAKTYTIQSWLNVTTYLTGEVAYYVDEYDANGNWISGKYLTGIRAAGTQTVSLQYTPTSVNVAKASLQVIVTSGSGITAYLDSVVWTTPS